MTNHLNDAQKILILTQEALKLGQQDGTNFQSLIELTEKMKGAKFVYLKNYKNAAGEVSNYLINCNLNYANQFANEKVIIEQNLDLLENLDIDEEKTISNLIKRNQFSKSDALDCINEVFNTLNKRINPTDEDELNTHQINFNDVKINDCLSFNASTRNFHLHGSLVEKEVIIDNSVLTKKRKKTLAKEAIYSLLEIMPSEKFRRFTLSPDKISSISVSGETLVFE